MKKITTLSLSIFLCYFCNAQLNPAQRAKDRAVANTNNKVDQTVDKAVDDAFNGIFKKKDKKKKNKSDDTNNQSAGNGNQNTGSSGSVSSPASSGGFSDFVPGAKVLFSDDFSKDAMGDFPAKWNSNGSGRVTTLSGLPGRWMALKSSTVVTPEMTKALPENATIEFDVYFQTGGTTPFIQFGLTPVKNVMREDMFYKDRFFMSIYRYDERDGQTVEYGLKNDVIGNKSDFPLTSYANKIMHISMAINKTRIRIYLDQTKVIDLPRALTAEMRNNFFLNSNAVIPAPDLEMFVSNVRIASSETDARSLLIKQLMEDGKAVTNDILFDVNSDVIKSSSYDIVNQFGDAMKANPSLKIRITGHTDSDGNAAANLDLSKKRAASVKRYIMNNYGIADNRIQTDGMGSTMPVADNSTAAGKVKNRRVEFLKL